MCLVHGRCPSSLAPFAWNQNSRQQARARRCWQRGHVPPWVLPDCPQGKLCPCPHLFPEQTWGCGFYRWCFRAHCHTSASLSMFLWQWALIMLSVWTAISLGTSASSRFMTGGKCWWVLALSKTTRQVTSSFLQPTVASIPLTFQAWNPDGPSSLMSMAPTGQGTIPHPCPWRLSRSALVPHPPSTQPRVENHGRLSHVGGRDAFAHTRDALLPAPVPALHLPFKVQSKGFLVWWLLHWWGAFPYCPSAAHGREFSRPRRVRIPAGVWCFSLDCPVFSVPTLSLPRLEAQ